MRWLIDYIRQCFCKHEWALVKEARVYEEDFDGKPKVYPSHTKYMYRCNKCGMCKKYIF